VLGKTLEKRRLRGDFIETYKILTGKENVDFSSFFVWMISITALEDTSTNSRNRHHDWIF